MKRLLSLVALIALPGHAHATGYGGVVQEQVFADEACTSGALQSQVVEAPAYSVPVVTGVAQTYSAPVVVRQQVVRQQVYQQPVVVQQRAFRQQFVAAQPVYSQAAPLVFQQQQHGVVQSFGGGYGASAGGFQRRGGLVGALFGGRRQRQQGTGSIQIQGSGLGRGTRIRARIR